MDLIASRRYQPDTEEPAEIYYIMMPVSELPVSAGLGAFLEGEMFQQIQVPASSVPAGAEFGIYVSRSEERRVGKECRSRWSPYH